MAESDTLSILHVSRALVLLSKLLFPFVTVLSLSSLLEGQQETVFKRWKLRVQMPSPLIAHHTCS